MRRSNISLIISLSVHILAALILTYVHRNSIVKKTNPSIPVQLNIKAPEPRLEDQKPKIKPVEINPDRRSVARAQSPRITKPDQKMVRTTAYKDVVVTDDSEALYGIGTPEEDVKLSDLLPSGSGARGAGGTAKGGRSQLVEFVDRSKGKRRIVYCMDVSASMGAADKLNLARNYLKDSILALDSKKDSFNIIAFAKQMRVFYPGDLIPATKENQAAALRFLDEYNPQNIKANTKTDLLAALLKALEMKPSVIAMVTDGLPTAGVTHPEEILQRISEQNADKSVEIFAIGMEMDQEQPEAWLLRAIAEQNKGEYQFL